MGETTMRNDNIDMAPFWVGPGARAQYPGVTLLTREFVSENGFFEAEYSADERGVILLDGRYVDAGPEHGDGRIWFLRYFRVLLEAGRHRLTVRLFHYGTEAAKPRAQVSLRPGFFLKSSSHPEVDTARKGWLAQNVAGVEFLDPTPAWGTGAKPRVDGAVFPWIAYAGADAGTDGWHPADAFRDSRELTPSTLPPQRRVPLPSPRIREGAGLPAGTIAPHTRRRWLLDFGTYVCAYYRLGFQGGAGARINLRWAETLFDRYEWTPDHGGALEKGDRSQVAGKIFHGVGDEIRPGLGMETPCVFESFWWNPGRYLELTVETQNQALQLEMPAFWDTGYPLAPEFQLHTADPRLKRMAEICFHTLSMCSHDTWYDCPYFEQLMYIGDAWIESLLTSVVSSDNRLQRHAIRLLGNSGRNRDDGMLYSRWPSWDVQVIPCFNLYYIWLVHDYACWRRDPEFVREMLPVCRTALSGLLSCRSHDGVLFPPGWNFIDWVRMAGWEEGVPPDSADRPNAIVNLLAVATLERMARLEWYCGAPEWGRKWEREADELWKSTCALFYDSASGDFTSDPGHRHHSEHAAIAALLTDHVPEPIRTRLEEKFRDGAWAVTPESSCFGHLLFEMAARFGLTELFECRVRRWYDFIDLNLTTTPEQFASPRSDCHAWSAHPLFHLFATIGGVRPGEFGFGSIRIAPLPHWKGGDIRFRIPHPDGWVEVSRDNAGLRFRVPPGVPVTVVWEGQEYRFGTSSGEVGRYGIPVADIDIPVYAGV